ncbi:hypothetical protein F5H01DRAFT_357280 [Linnemannia elongata]|nr:hypothetical protein F5H01DRAFT_357280 [Linnemannia elongata]
MKTSFFTATLLALTVSLSTFVVPVVQGGNILSSIFHPRQDPNRHLQNNELPSPHNQVPNLDWNSQIGASNQHTMQHQVASTHDGQHAGPGCRTRDRVYLPDMQSFLIKTPLTYEEAVQACEACGSELVLVDGTNVDRFREAFSSLGLFSDQRFWIKSWFGEQVQRQGDCPATYINPFMGNRLEPVEDNCNARFFALCY